MVYSSKHNDAVSVFHSWISSQAKSGLLFFAKTYTDWIIASKIQQENSEHYFACETDSWMASYIYIPVIIFDVFILPSRRCIYS